MSDTKKLGQITHVYFGHGGYQDACIGIHFSFGGDGWGVSDTKSAWDSNLISSENAKWTEADRSKQYDEIIRYISDLLSQAKVHNLNELRGKPVEVTFDDMVLKEWRLLTEVI